MNNTERKMIYVVDGCELFELEVERETEKSFKCYKNDATWKINYRKVNLGTEVFLDKEEALKKNIDFLDRKISFISEELERYNSILKEKKELLEKE